MRRHEFSKLTSSLDDIRQSVASRLKQWDEYEQRFEKLIAWLSESEQVLKSFAPRGTRQQKQEQLQKFEVGLAL